MKEFPHSELIDGVYRILFKDGTSSLALVKTTKRGRTYYVALNEVVTDIYMHTCSWSKVKKVKLLIEREPHD